MFEGAPVSASRLGKWISVATGLPSDERSKMGPWQIVTRAGGSRNSGPVAGAESVLLDAFGPPDSWGAR